MNCIIVDDDKISRRIIQNYILKTDFLILIKSCTNAIEAVNILQNEMIQLIFLDVEMPEMNGLEFIKTLEEKPQIILVTAHEKYAVEAFEHNVTDYIVKPISYSRFLKAVTKVKSIYDKHLNHNSGLPYIFVKTDSKLIRINTKDIFYIEALADYVNIITPKEKYVVHSTMKGIESKLPNQLFQRVHRSFIVRLDKINSIDENTLVINDNLIPIGGSYRKKLLTQINLI